MIVAGFSFSFDSELLRSHQLAFYLGYLRADWPGLKKTPVEQYF